VQTPSAAESVPIVEKGEHWSGKVVGVETAPMMAVALAAAPNVHAESCSG